MSARWPTVDCSMSPWTTGSSRKPACSFLHPHEHRFVHPGGHTFMHILCIHTRRSTRHRCKPQGSRSPQSIIRKCSIRIRNMFYSLPGIAARLALRARACTSASFAAIVAVVCDCCGRNKPRLQQPQSAQAPRFVPFRAKGGIRPRQGQQRQQQPARPAPPAAVTAPARGPLQAPAARRRRGRLHRGAPEPVRRQGAHQPGNYHYYYYYYYYYYYHQHH